MLETKQRLTRDAIAARVAAEIPDGAYVNLGIGMPTSVANFVRPEQGIVFHAENGALGTGPTPAPGEELPDLVNAGGQPTTLLPGAYLMDSAQSFAIVRGGHLDVAVLGGLQVSEQGDLANWRRADRRAGSIGGAADIAANAKRLFVAMEHTTRDGQPKIVRHCSYPLTGARVVKMIFTDLAVIRIDADGLILEETAPGWSSEEIQSLTEAPLRVSPHLKEIMVAVPSGGEPR
jgi:3-oxoacid CoA-transferase B subunit